MSEQTFVNMVQVIIISTKSLMSKFQLRINNSLYDKLQCKELRSDLHMVFVDFEKAFDSVHRDYIWEALRSRGIPDKIIAIIKATYNGAKCRLRT